MEISRDKAIDAVIALFSVVAAGFLVAASLERWSWREYQTLRIWVSIVLVCGIFFFLKRRRGIAALAIFNLILIGVFTTYKGSRSDWVVMDRVSAVILLAPFFVIACDYISPKRLLSIYESIKELGKVIVGWSIVGLVFWAVYLYDGSESGGRNKFVSENALEQIVDLSPWEDYTGKRWLFLEKKGSVFKIQEGNFWGDSPLKTVMQGTWVFDSATNSITLTSSDITQQFAYVLNENADQAFLGVSPVEMTPLKYAWHATPPFSENDYYNSGP